MTNNDDVNFSMSEKETLIRVEQQLKDSIKNQTQIIEDLRTIFARIEKESKIIGATRADIKAHLESSVVRKEDLTNRFKWIEERHNELKETVAKFKDEVRANAKSSNENSSEEDRIDVLEKDFIQFKTEISTSVSTTRWIFGALIGSIGVILSVIELLKWLKGGH